MSKQNEVKELKDSKNKYCFVIMPISEPEDRNHGHFRRVYEDIFKPACEKAGYQSVRADDVHKTNFIQLDIIQKLIESPMAICDLSTRNPNVLYELGMRQAFDMPTVLVQELNTPQIFDINVLRYTEYNQNLDYREVLKAQIEISRAIEETEKANKKSDNVNSLIKLMGLKKAEIVGIENSANPDITKLLLSEINIVRREISNFSSLQAGNSKNLIPDARLKDLDAFEKGVSQLETSIKDGMSINVLKAMFDALQSEYFRLNSMTPADNQWQSRLLTDLWHRLMPLNPSFR